MAQPMIKLQSALLRDYYRYFSKYAHGRSPDKKVAWVTSFTPVEILEALGIYYCYPESYAAVIAASGMEQQFLSKSSQRSLCLDCCSYSCCIEGCLALADGPRGTPPKPDILIATNNQCDTLPNWWNILSERYDAPLLVLDYPGETFERGRALAYVTAQHKDLIAKLEKLSGNILDEEALEQCVNHSRDSIRQWEILAGNLKKKDVKPMVFFDDISYLITSRCKPNTAKLYEILGEELANAPDADGGLIPIYWIGYPLWYHSDRYLSECLEGFRVCGSNYITWWNLDFRGEDVFEQLFNAYNYTFLNLSQKTRTERLTSLIKDSGAACAVSLRNKSCKCDFVSAREIGIVQTELEMDMIDREFLSQEKAKSRIGLLRDAICSR